MDFRFIDDPMLPGNAAISGAQWNRARDVFGVVSEFRRLTEPPGRAAYSGRRLATRLALYRPPSRTPIAVFDASHLPITCVAFHPHEPVALVGAGSYDGGYLFQGSLTLWNWSTGEVRDLGRIPTVLTAAFSDDGRDAHCVVCPWDEGQTEELGVAPFETCFRITLSDVRAGGFFTDAIEAQMQGPPAAMADVLRDLPEGATPESDIQAAFGGQHTPRSPIWDVALLDAETIAAVHDDCRLQLFSRTGALVRTYEGDSDGHGVQILHGGGACYVHVAHSHMGSDGWLKDRAEIAQLRGHDLTEVASFEGRYLCSISKDGALLARKDRSPRGPQVGNADMIGAGRSFKRFDLGHYDVFNHALRIDGAPDPFFVQGTPPSSHKDKFLCTVTTSGKVKRLWRILPDNGDHASHAMECWGAYVADQRGPGLIVAGKHYDPSPYSNACFLFRKSIVGEELWRYTTQSAAAAIKVTRDQRYVLIAFLNGDFAVLRADTGETVRWAPFAPDGVQSVIYSMDVDDTSLLIGTIDGRIGLAPLDSVLRPA